MEKLLTLGRPVVPSCFTNRLIAILTLIVLALVAAMSLLRGEPFSTALGGAFAAAFAFFLTWSLGRELDPAQDWSAFVAPPLVLGFALLVSVPSLAALFFMVLCCRVVNGTTGFSARILDVLLILGLGGVLHHGGYVTALPLLLVVFLADSLLRPRNSAAPIYVLATIVFLAVMFSLFPPGPPEGALNGVFLLLMLYLAAMLVILTRLAGVSQVPVDSGGAFLEGQRVTVGRIVPVIFITSETLLQGGQAPWDHAPLLLAFGGAALYNVLRYFWS